MSDDAGRDQNQDQTLGQSQSQSQSQSQHVGPIIFSHEIPREQLQNEGEVITFRTTHRTTGNTWWRKSRTGKKQGDVSVAYLTQCQSVETLAEYNGKSGFNTFRDWHAVIREVHGQPVTADGGGHLFYVTEGHVYRG